MICFFQDFLKKMAASFRSIVKSAKHDVTEDDLKQDAWIIAQEIGEKRGREIDFSDPVDQNLVIRRVNFRNVKRGDWKLRKAIRIDYQSDDDEVLPNWAECLVGPASSDPLVSILLRESVHKLEDLLANSYSQAVAYLVAFANLRNSRLGICKHLAIASGTLDRRMSYAAAAFKVQPSLFDGVERISSHFIPPPGRAYIPKVERSVAGHQFFFEFTG